MAKMQLTTEALAVGPAMTAALVLTQAPAKLVVEPDAEANVQGLRLAVSAAVHRWIAFATSPDFWAEP